jgi:Chaperone of endosialidase
MASTINALTSGGGVAIAGDTSGQLQLQTNNGVTAVTVDASQNVGINVTPSAWATYKTLQTPADSFISFSGGFGVLQNNTYYNAGYKYIANTFASQYNQQNGAHIWTTAPSGTAGNPITFTESMRIDSSGNLLVGTTSSLAGIGARLNIVATGNQRATVTGNGNVGEYMTNTSSTGNWQPFSFCNNGTSFSQIGSITTSSVATLYNTTSDRRLKENIVDAPSALDLIDSVKVRSFDFKSDGSHTEFGLIAQEFYEVAPQCVAKGDDGEEITQTWALDSSALVPAIIKAMQELKAEVDAQAEEIKALKGVA